MRKLVFLCLILSLTLGLAPLAAAADRDRALAVIEQAIKAHGGEEALKRLQFTKRSYSGTLFVAGKELAFGSEVDEQLPKSCRLALDLDAGGQKNPILIVINNDKGWQSAGGAATELGKERLAELREELYAGWTATLVPLKKDKAFELAPLSDAEVQGEPAAGVMVKHKDHANVELYFNKKTHLLVRLQRTATEAGKPVKRELLFSNFKSFDGVKLPSRQTELLNGAKISESTLRSCKFLKAGDEGRFAKP